MKKILASAAALVAITLVTIPLGVGWYYSGELQREALTVDRAPSRPDLTVTAVGDRSITLHITPSTDLAYGSWRTSGVWGVDGTAGWYGTAGEITARTADEVVRPFASVRGTPTPGERIRLDGNYLDGDPATADGLPFDPITYQSDVGSLGAWRIAGASRTWAILIHGKGASRREMLRFLPSFAKVGLPMLVIDYRNDADAPLSASRFYDYGASEWHDVEAAAQYALNNGADSLVLYGISMGGAIATSFLSHSRLADRVRAVVLDAPVLSFADVVQFGAERRNLPSAVTWLGMSAAALRFGFSWDDLDYLEQAAKLKAPILLFHGDADRLVNVRTSRALSRARPDLVTYVEVPGATHARSWNVDPDKYDAAVVSFLARILGQPVAQK
jgi:pimeloyl-ACP methyl ester carboxylesterase